MKNLSRVLVSFILLFGISAAYGRELPYKNRNLPVEERVKDLLGRMTLEEKIGQMQHVHRENVFEEEGLNDDKLKSFCGNISFGFAECLKMDAKDCTDNFRRLQDYMVNETRLGIPVIITTESLHGSVQYGCTIYPQNIAMGSTFNPSLANEKARLISGELHTMNIRQVLAPNIDVVRDLRWGRVEESFGEDPYLCSLMGLAEVNGYLDNSISPMIKHFGAHGSPVGGLNLASVSCGTRDMIDIYLKPFETIVRNTDVKTIMSSYNSVNRIPNSASHFLMTELLRNRWGYKGLVYSDWAAIDMLRNFQCVAEDKEDAAIMALTAGLDVEASSDCFQTLAEAVKEGRLDESKIDTAVSRILRVKFELGLFESPYNIPSLAKPIHDKEMVKLSRRIADESTVLLKNDNNLLPLDIKSIKSIAVIGPNANQVQFGDYSWSKDNKDGVTPLAGIKKLVGSKVKVNYAPGCDLVTMDSSLIPEAVKAAQSSDIVVLCCGSSSTRFIRHIDVPSTSGEGIDLNDISLTGVQHDLIRAVYATGRPVVLVLVSGKPFAIPWEKENIPAILAQWYAGEEAGTSLAHILFGKVNPSGKLNFSFPKSTGHLPAYYNHLPSDKGYYKKPGKYGAPGRDYVFSSPDNLWSFGHGLSYTTFQYSGVSTDKNHYSADDTIHVSLSVKNTGSMAGKEVVQVYVRDVVSSMVTPVKQLKAFQKISLKPSETKTVHLSVPVKELYLMDETGNRFFEAGEFEIQVGTASDDIKEKITVVAGDYTKKVTKAATFVKKDKLSGRIINVSGIVCDVQATPLANVEVYSANQEKLLGVTNEKGEYKLPAHSDDTLLFRYKGYTDTYVSVGSSKVINVKLAK